MADAVTNGVKLIGETVMPGTSLLLDGDIKGGGLHAVVGLAAKYYLGPLGWFLVALDSYSKSTSGRYLHQQFQTNPDVAARQETTEQLTTSTKDGEKAVEHKTSRTKS